MYIWQFLNLNIRLISYKTNFHMTPCCVCPESVSEYVVALILNNKINILNKI
jgi:hypothetical protein